ncbi:hypothetical protein [Leucobacter sp. W1038]|uniref:hypothetical protein n=1 Tax=Leucobacter sp. W1038 TaxID=3438281 RepID=UPI003D95296E
MRKVLRIASPSFSSVLQRLTQLLVLVALGQLSDGLQQSALFASFGIIAAFGVIADSGAGNFLLSQSAQSIGRRELNYTILIHFGIATAGTILTVSYCFLVFGESLGALLPLVVFLALAQFIEGLLRVAKAPLLLAGRDLAFGAVDLPIILGRAALVVAAMESRQLYLLCWIPAVSGIVLVAAYAYVYRRIQPIGTAKVRPRAVLKYGLAGASSALYSQSPVLVAGLMLPVAQAGTLSLVTRLIQPTEILPATLSQQAMPRLRSRKLDGGQFGLGLFLMGICIAACIFFVWPAVEALFSVQGTMGLILLLLLASLPFKFLNYALVAHLYVRDAAIAKMAVSIGVGALIILLSVTGVAYFGVVGVASAIFVGEVLLMGGLLFALRKTGTERSE